MPSELGRRLERESRIRARQEPRTEQTQWWPADKSDLIVALFVSHLIAAFLGKAFL